MAALLVCRTTGPSPESVCLRQHTPARRGRVGQQIPALCQHVRRQAPAHCQGVRWQIPVHFFLCQITDPSPLSACQTDPTHPILSASDNPKFHPCSSVVDLALGSCTKSTHTNSAPWLPYKGNSMSCMEELSRETAWSVSQEGEGGGSVGLQQCWNVFVCRQPGDDIKMLVCDTCDKGYHTFCLRPAMTTIPKNGWKCKVPTSLFFLFMDLVTPTPVSLTCLPPTVCHLPSALLSHFSFLPNQQMLKLCFMMFASWTTLCFKFLLSPYKFVTSGCLQMFQRRLQLAWSRKLWLCSDMSNWVPFGCTWSMVLWLCSDMSVWVPFGRTWSMVLWLCSDISNRVLFGCTWFWHVRLGTLWITWSVVLWLCSDMSNWVPCGCTWSIVLWLCSDMSDWVPFGCTWFIVCDCVLTCQIGHSLDVQDS